MYYVLCIMYYVLCINFQTGQVTTGELTTGEVITTGQSQKHLLTRSLSSSSFSLLSGMYTCDRPSLAINTILFYTLYIAKYTLHYTIE